MTLLGMAAWAALTLSIALSFIAFGRGSLWWVFLLSALLSLFFCAVGLLSIGPLLLFVPLLQLAWAVAALLGTSRRWPSLAAVLLWAAVLVWFLVIL